MKTKLFFLSIIFTFAIFTNSSYSQVSGTNSTSVPDLTKDMATSLRTYKVEGSNSIRLEWNPPKESGFVIVARSNYRIDTPDKLYYADSLGKFKSDPLNTPYTSHIDINLKPGIYYYSVVMADVVKKQSVVLVPNQNYTTIPIEILETKKQDIVVEKPKPVEVEAPAKELYVTNIKLLEIANNLRVEWKPPVGSNSPLEYIVYLSEKPLSDLRSFKKARIVKKLNSPKTSVDIPVSEIRNQKTYIGISVNHNTTEFLPLVQEQSYTFYESEITEPVKEVVVAPREIVPAVKEDQFSQLSIKNLMFALREDEVLFEDGLLFIWTAPDGARLNETFYTIYESEEPLDTINLQKAVPIATLYHPESIFLYPKYNKLKPIYIGVSVSEKGKKESPHLLENVSYLKIDPDIILSMKKKSKSIVLKDTEKPVISEKIEVVITKDTEKPLVEPQIADSGKEEPKTVTEDNPKKIISVDDNEFKTIMDSSFKKREYKKAIVDLDRHVSNTVDNGKRARGMFYIALSYFRMGDYSNSLKILSNKEVMQNYDQERVNFYMKRCLEYKGKGI
jgi:hypothetical protein